jgi:hypothetical protein
MKIPKTVQDYKLPDRLPDLTSPHERWLAFVRRDWAALTETDIHLLLPDQNLKTLCLQSLKSKLSKR